MSVSARIGDPVALDNLGVPMLVITNDGHWTAAQGDPDQITGDETAVSAGGAAVSLTWAATPNYGHVTSGFVVSYSAAPTGGGFTLADGATTIFQIDITAAGPFVIPFVPAKEGVGGHAMTATLAAPGGAIVGKINAIGHWLKFRPSGDGILNFADENNSGLELLIF